MGLVACLAAFGPELPRARAQWPYAAPTTPDAQRNALNSLQAQVNWLQNATRTAPTYGNGGYGVLAQQFASVRGAYTSFKSTLTPQQLDYGANDLAEQEAGLDIIQEAFGNYAEDIANGRSSSSALRTLCQVLGQATNVWWQECKRDAARLRVGMF